MNDFFNIQLRKVIKGIKCYESYDMDHIVFSRRVWHVLILMIEMYPLMFVFICTCAHRMVVTDFSLHSDE